MPITKHTDGGFTLTGDSIQDYRFLVLIQGLKSELRGLRLTRGGTCYAILKSEYGFKGNRQRVLAQAEAFKNRVS